MAKCGSSCSASRKALVACGYWKLWRRARPRRNAGCATAAPEFAKVTPASIVEAFGDLISEVDKEALAGPMADFLAESAGSGRVALTGYCMGARVGWRIATAMPDRVAALAGFHAGGLVTEDPDSPHRSASDISAELYFGFADQDPSMTAEQISTFERALEEAGARYRS